MSAVTDRREPKSRGRRVILGLTPIAVVLLVWEGSVAGGWVTSENWPAVSQILSALAQEGQQGDLALALGHTAVVVALGFVAGALGAVGLAAAAVLSATTRSGVTAIVELLRPIPVPALVPPLVLLFGTELEMRLVVVSASVLFPVFLNTLAGFDGLDPHLRLMATTHRLTRLAFVRDIAFPAALPALFSGLRIGFGISVVVTVTTEIVVGGSGIGHYLTMMQFAARPAEMYGAVLVLLVFSYLANIPIKWLESSCVFWKNRTS